MDDIYKCLACPNGEVNPAGILEFDKIEDEFRKRTILRIMKKRYDAGVYLPELKAIEDGIPKPVKESVLRDWIWLTINPKPEIQLPNFLEALGKLVKRKIFSEYKYVVEQRGTLAEDNLGKGFHAHMLLRRAPDKEYKQTKRQVKNSFKNICNVEHDKVFYWKECREDFLEDKIEYMTGVKTGEAKDEKQKADIEWRKQNDIEILFSS